MSEVASAAAAKGNQGKRDTAQSQPSQSAPQQPQQQQPAQPKAAPAPAAPAASNAVMVKLSGELSGVITGKAPSPDNLYLNGVSIANLFYREAKIDVDKLEEEQLRRGGSKILGRAKISIEWTPAEE